MRELSKKPERVNTIKPERVKARVFLVFTDALVKCLEALIVKCNTKEVRPKWWGKGSANRAEPFLVAMFIFLI